MKILKYISFMLINGLVQCNATSSDQFNNYNVKQAKLLRKGFTYLFWNSVHSNSSIFSIISSDCTKSLNYVTRALEEGKEWPLAMMDSSSRFVLDALSTGYYDFGNYDKCLDINWINDESKEVQFGQHCTSSILPTMSESEWPVNMFTRNKIIDVDHDVVFKIALCVPSSCTREDIFIILTKVLEPFEWHHIKVDQCKVKTTFIDAVINSTRAQKLALTFLIFIVTLNLYATWFDWTLKTRTNEKTVVLIRSHWSRHLSLINAYDSLINPGSSARMRFLTKLQILVHTLTVTTHSLMWFIVAPAFGLYANAMKSALLNRDYWLVRGGLADYLLEILFFYGGIARSMEYWRSTSSTTPLASSFRNMFIKMFAIILHLIPLFAFTLITPLLTDGPLSSAFGEYSASSCMESFHYNLLFWQNSYDPVEKTCFMHTWSIAVEFKLLPVIIILIHLYKKLPKFSALINASIVAYGFIHVGVNVFIYNLEPNPFIRKFSARSILECFVFHHLRTLAHTWLYLAAPLWTYFIMNKYDKSNAILSKFTKLGKLFIVNILLLHILPFIWIGLSQFDGPVFNSLYAIIYRILALSFWTFIIMSNADQLRQFFTHPMDKEASLSTENDKVTVKKNADKHSNQLLHIASTLLRSSYYVHINIIILLYTGERWPGNTFTALVIQVLKNLFFTLFGGFAFHLFVAYPVLSLCSTLKAKSKSKSQ